MVTIKTQQNLEKLEKVEKKKDVSERFHEQSVRNLMTHMKTLGRL